MDDDTLASGASGPPPARGAGHLLAPGTVFAGEFRVLRMVGRGGMGAVYAVEQLATGRERALKLMDAALVTDPRSRERFLQEARVGSRIASEHVVEVVDAGVEREAGVPWIAMELLEGETLADRLAAGGALPPAEAWEILEQLGHALGAAHAAGIVHRDVKPENVFLARPRRSDVRRTVKVLDFGIAKLLRSAVTSGHTTAAVGSPMWMAPEQTGAGQISPAADVWSLGLLAFQVLTGHVYWKTAQRPDAPLGALLTEMLVDDPAPATARAATLPGTRVLPAGFDAWFARCVVRDPAARFRNAAEAIAALGPLLGVKAAAATAAAPPAAAVRTPTERLPAPATTTTDAARAVAVTGAAGTDVGVSAERPAGRRRAMLPVAVLTAVVAVLATYWLLRAFDGAPREPERNAAQTVVRVAESDVDLGPHAADAARSVPAAVLDAAEGTPPSAAEAAVEAGEGGAAPDGTVGADGGVAGDAGDAAALEPSAAAPERDASPASGEPDAGGRRPPVGGRMTRAARQFHNAVVVGCWLDNPPTDPRPVSVAFRVTYDQYGTMRTFTVRGDVSDQFKYCVGTRGRSFRFQPLPDEPVVAWRTMLGDDEVP
ncbi:MAG: serine/threonine protein kinase [Deltaproteobacteria bacterium]|nr:serine/threonine protein kinase [Deltaproteobacteria bacterium]